jgi:hypothetical protein
MEKNKTSVGHGNCYIAIHWQVGLYHRSKSSVLDSVDITVPNTSFVFSISFLIFNSENISFFISNLSCYCFR